MDYRDDAWNLIEAGRYDEAARQLACHIDTGIDVALGHFGNKAVAELAAGRPLEAERTLKQAQLFAEQDEFSRGSDLLLELSEVQWLNRDAEAAVRSLTSRIQRLKDGSATFADAAGGGSDGLILYYYGVRLGRASIVENAWQWLERVLERRQWRLKPLPGPLVRWFFGELDDSQILVEGCGTNSMEKALMAARMDVLTSRQLFELCFHRGVRAMREGEWSRSQEFLQRAVSLPNPLVDYEWYLAKHEASLTSRTSG